MSIETLKNEEEKIKQAQKDILAKPVLSVKHDPGLLNKLEMRRDVLHMVLMTVEKDELTPEEAIKFWLESKQEEMEFVQSEIELHKCYGTIPAIVMRGQRFERLEFDIAWLRELVEIEARG